MVKVIRLNYPAMQEMAQQCVKVAERLKQTNLFARQIAQELQAGAMVGNAGELLSNTLSSSLATNVQHLSDKFMEINKDIQGAIADMQAQDQQASGKFKT